MKVIVCGSRKWTARAPVFERISEFPRETVIISGGANGVDTLAIRCAQVLHMTFREYRADWGTYGKRAGIVRNRLMLEAELPDLVLAFWDGKSPGTKHMITIAREASVETEVHLAEDLERCQQRAAAPDQSVERVHIDTRVHDRN